MNELSARIQVNIRKQKKENLTYKDIDINGSQALEFRRPLKSSDFIESFVKSYREDVSFVTEDRIFHYDIEKSIGFLNSFQMDLEN